MKQIASNYTYSPTTNVVTLTGVNIDQDQLLLVVAPQVGRTMYNFASGVTGAVSAGADTRVTLNASTVGLTTTSPLVIFYDDQAAAQAVTGTVALDPASLIALENVTVTIGSSVTIAGTVTANVGGIASGVTLPVRLFAEREGAAPTGEDRLVVCSDDGRLLVDATAAGTSVVNYDGEAFVRVKMTSASSVTVGNSVTIGSLPAVSGTVTAAAPNGSLTTRFGTPTTANTAFATAAVTKSDRKYLLIQNVTTGSNVITVGIGFTPTTTQGIQLTAGAGITFESSYIPTGAVYVLSSVTASNFTILEA